MDSSHTYKLSDIDAHWRATDQATLLFVVENENVLLIRKKRGLGAGKINGPGGKFEQGETAQQCAHREVAEELCIEVNDSQQVGRLRFQFTDAYSIDVHVFLATHYAGTPMETAEAEPLWFAKADIPYDEMWADDRLWLPRVLAGDTVDGRLIFAKDVILEHELVYNRRLFAVD